MASGLRSSWLASETKVRSRATASSTRARSSLSVRPRASELVVAAAGRQPLPEVRGRQRRCAAAHALDRPQRRTGQQVAGQRGKQERSRATEQQHTGQVRQRLIAVLERLPDDDDELLVLCSHRLREQPDVLVAGELCVGAHALASLRGGELPAAQQRLCGEPRRAVEHVPGAVDELGELDATPASGRAPCLPQARVRFPRQRRHVARASVQAAVHRSVQGRRQPPMDEDPGRCEHDGDDRREGERQAPSDRHAGQDSCASR
jgi:hypothetical protein